MPQKNQNKVGVWKPNEIGDTWQSKYPNGDAPAPSGGDSILSWSAPQGLKDGGELIISSETITFIEPESFAFIGFGSGWLEDQPDGAKFVSHAVNTALGEQQFIAEDSPSNSRRSVARIGGIPFLKSMLSGDSATNANSGFINWDSGRPLAPGDRAFMYSRARITLRPEDVGQESQFKQERMGPVQSLSSEGDSANSAYVRQAKDSDGMGVTCYEGSLSARSYSFPGGTIKDGVLTDFGWLWKQNTVDQQDGAMYTISARSGKYLRAAPYISSSPHNPNGVIKTPSEQRPRWLKWQDYVGNNSSLRNAEVIRTDMYVQINGSHYFFLGDNPDPAKCTRFCKLIPTEFKSSSSWKFNLWKGALSSYNNAAIFVLDQDLNFVAGVSL